MEKEEVKKLVDELTEVQDWLQARGLNCEKVNDLKRNYQRKL